MVLYKNVDICDLESIVKNGILSMDECGNNNWGDGKRSDNDTSVVYLFKPIAEKNVFPSYGIALLEIDCAASENRMPDNDAHNRDYVEYVTKEVKPEWIRKVIIPRIFKGRISLPENIKVTWCEMYAEEYGDGDEKRQITENRMELFAATAPLNTIDFNYFRGTDEKRHMIDLYNIKYIYE